MDLHTGVPLWRDLAPPEVPYGPAHGDLDCEVAVLGGGVSGALVAYYLTREGVDTLLVDKAQPARGSTAASTGLLQYEIDTPLSDLVKTVGVERAVYAYRRGLWAIDEIERLAGELGDGCGFSRCQSLYFASRAWHARRLRREYECRREHGFALRYLSRRELADITTIRAPCACSRKGTGKLIPTRSPRASCSVPRGRACEHSLTPKSSPWKKTRAAWPCGRPRGALPLGAAVIATGYAAHEQLKSPPGTLHSTYAVASAPMNELPGWPARCLIWETARPYFYGRRTDDGRAIIGGGDTAFSDDHQREELIAQDPRLSRAVQSALPRRGLRTCLCLGRHLRRNQGRNGLHR